MSHGRSTNSAKDRAGLRVNGVVFSFVSDCRVIFIIIPLHACVQTHVLIQSIGYKFGHLK
jgi:hypothetical protein